jgi:hypothetical protein
MEQVQTDTNGREANLRRVQDTLTRYLSDNPTFLAMDRAQQVEFYRHALASGLSALEQPARELAERRREANAIGDPTRLKDVGALAGGFLEEVDFPTFVQALVTGTYSSIVKSTIEQMNAYVDMYKGLAQPLASIAKSISDADALGQVASNDPMKFTMGSDGEVTDNDTGMVLDRTNADVQRMMFEAKLALARERRLLLRETMLMGVQRLVVDQGLIKAGLLFNIKATEKGVQRQRQTEIEESGGQMGGSFFGLFGGGKSDKETKISVSTRSLDTDTQLAAQITGNVEIRFKTDRFDLNNFAGLFGNEATKAELQQRTAASTPAGAAPPTSAVPAAAPAVPAAAPSGG